MRAVIIIAARIVAKCFRRARDHGLRSGWTCARAYFFNGLVRLRNRFGAKDAVACPCCGWTGAQFRHIDCGKFLVPHAECPQCKGHERHRMMHLYLTRKPPSFLAPGTEGWLLHFAPEHHLLPFLKPVPGLCTLNTDVNRHLLVDPPGAAMASDMEHLPLTDKSIRAAVCLHVLEHVPSDVNGLRELARVLSDDGEAIIMVPFMMGQTETEEYGRPIPDWFDHVRGYSPLDFKHRLTDFDYEEVFPASFLSADEIDRYKVPDSQVIYLCRPARVAHSETPAEAAARPA